MSLEAKSVITTPLQLNSRTQGHMPASKKSSSYISSIDGYIHSVTTRCDSDFVYVTKVSKVYMYLLSGVFKILIVNDKLTGQYWMYYIHT